MNIHLSNHEHFALIEASWNRATVIHQSIMRRSVDEWYYLLRPQDHAQLLGAVRRLLDLHPNPESICGKAQRVWLGRYDAEAQYLATNAKGSERCFLVGGKYHTISFT